MAPRKRAKRGKAEELAFPPSPNGFPALPLDILYEIFSLLRPLDLLHLARTTKPFRRFLLNRANVGIWRAAFSVLREEGFPECPSYSAEPAWTRLVFEKSCHVCSANLRDNPNLDSVWWEFSARYCGGCVTSKVSKSLSQKLKRIDPKRNWKATFPSVPRNRDARDSCRYYLTAHQTELMDAHAKAENTEARAAIIQRRLELTLLITQHSSLWRDWGRKQIQDRQDAAARRQVEKQQKEQATEEARVEALMAKLTALGWADEPWMLSGSLRLQIRRYDAVVVPRVLTPRAYRELEPELLSQLNRDKHAYIVRRRLTVFQKAFSLIISKDELRNLALDIPPNPVDVALTPTVRELLDEPGDAELDQSELVAKLKPIMPTILQTWIAESLARIGDHARNAFDSGGQCPDLKSGVESLGELNSSGEVIDPLSLAIAFVGCPWTCGAAGHLPTLLKHSCTRRQDNLNMHWLHTRLFYGSGANHKDAYEGAAARVFNARDRFTPSSLDFKSRLSAVEAVVKAYERDPRTTTIEDMTVECRLVSCGICVDKAKDPRESSKPQVVPAPMDWLAAMRHSLKAHLTERDAKLEWVMSGDTRSSDVVV